MGELGVDDGDRSCEDLVVALNETLDNMRNADAQKYDSQSVTSATTAVQVAIRGNLLPYGVNQHHVR